MAIVLISWGDKKPDQRLVDKMIEKAKAFHVVSDPKFVYGYRWPNPDGTAASWDTKAWHIRDDASRAPQHSQGVEGVQGLLEGLQEGWDLRGKQ
jgi:hypothetical protein